MIGFDDLVDLWVIKIKKPMILCARSTSRSREQKTKRRSRSESMRTVCLFYSQNNKIGMIIKHSRHIIWEIHGVCKGLWDFFLDCAFRMLIGWACKLRSRDWLQSRGWVLAREVVSLTVHGRAILWQDDIRRLLGNVCDQLKYDKSPAKIGQSKHLKEL